MAPGLCALGLVSLIVAGHAFAGNDERGVNYEISRLPELSRFHSVGLIAADRRNDILANVSSLTPCARSCESKRSRGRMLQNYFTVLDFRAGTREARVVTMNPQADTGTGVIGGNTSGTVVLAAHGESPLSFACIACEDAVRYRGPSFWKPLPMGRQIVGDTGGILVLDGPSGARAIFIGILQGGKIHWRRLAFISQHNPSIPQWATPGSRSTLIVCSNNRLRI